MLKLLSTLLLLSSSLLAISNGQMEEFVKGQLSKNPNVELKSVTVRDNIELEGNPQWHAFIVDMKASVKQKEGMRDFESQDILFANDTLIAPELIDVKTGESIKSSVSPSFKTAYYKDENLVMGNKDAKHKIVLFSDPLCPFCINFVKKMVPYIQKHPKTFALYYYHFPLLRIHPASNTIVKAMDAATRSGKSNVLYLTYTSTFDPQETNEKKILNAFNKALRMDLAMSDLNTAEVLAHIEEDKRIAMDMLVNSTPTVFFDGKKDSSREKYKNVMKID